MSMMLGILTILGMNASFLTSFLSQVLGIDVLHGCKGIKSKVLFFKSLPSFRCIPHLCNEHTEPEKQFALVTRHPPHNLHTEAMGVRQ